MASDSTQKPGKAAPWGLLSPGVLWLVLFFLVPVFSLFKMALSSRSGSRFAPPTFDWNFGNFADAFSQYGTHFLTSFAWAGMATIAAILIGYPLAYTIAAYGGRFKDLLIGLVVVPFFTSYLVRTIAWTSILADQSWLNQRFQDVFGADFNLTGSWYSVVGGLTYNFLPFMILPIYVALEKIDFRLNEASADLYATPMSSFWRVIFPLSLPGVFAGSLLVFIPAAGDFINAKFLGAPGNKLVGKAVQDQFLVQIDYPVAAALSLALMAIITVAVLAYSRAFGTEGLAA